MTVSLENVVVNGNPAKISENFIKILRNAHDNEFPLTWQFLKETARFSRIQKKYYDLHSEVQRWDVGTCWSVAQFRST